MSRGTQLQEMEVGTKQSKTAVNAGAKAAENTKYKINTLVDQGVLEEYKLSLFNEFLNSL